MNRIHKILDYLLNVQFIFIQILILGEERKRKEGLHCSMFRGLAFLFGLPPPQWPRAVPKLSEDLN